MQTFGVYGISGSPLAFSGAHDERGVIDTGRDNHDNVTRNSTPNLNVFLDDARLLEFINLHMQPDTVDNGVHDTVGNRVGPVDTVRVVHGRPVPTRSCCGPTVRARG